MKNLKFNFYNFYTAILVLIALLPIIAPILLKLGLTLPAKLIYFIYSFFCHQFATRSIHFADIQYAWCSRDTGIWLGVALGAILLKYKKVSAIKWYWVIPFTIPIALDGGLQTIFTMLNLGSLEIPFYSSNNLVRFLTGSIFGLGFSMWISGIFYADSVKNPATNSPESNSSELNIKVANKNRWNSNLSPLIKNVRNLFLAQSFLVISYAFMVFLWQSTSNIYLPSDSLDTLVKLQDKNFFERRANGPCPTSGVQDLFVVNCFFEGN